MLEQIRIVLVGTSHTGNIGSVAPRYENYGLKQVGAGVLLKSCLTARLMHYQQAPVIFWLVLRLWIR